MKYLHKLLSMVCVAGLLVACHANSELPEFSDGVYFQNGHLARIGTGSIENLAWSPDGKTIALVTESGIRLLDATTLVEHTYIDPQASVSTLHFSPNGDWIATDYGYQEIAVWNAQTGALQSVLSVDGHINVRSARSSFPPSSSRQSLVFSPDGEMLAFQVWSLPKKTIQVWDWLDERKIHEWGGAESKSLYSGPVFSPDGQGIISTWENEGIQIWDTETGALIQQIDHEAFKLSLSQDGKRALVRSRKGMDIVVLDTEVSRTLLNEFDPTWALFNYDDSRVITHLATHEISTIQVWDAGTGEQLQEIEDPGYILGFDISPDGKKVVTFNCRDQVKVWSLETAEMLYAAQASPINGKTIAFSPEGSELAVANRNGISFYSTETGELLQTFSDKGAGVWMVAYNPDGSLLASINAEGEVKIIDRATGRTRQKIVPATDEEKVYWPISMTGVQFSADGSHLIAWSWREGEYPLRIWDTATWEEIQTISSQEFGALSPDGKRLAVKNEERLSIVDVETQELLFILQDSSRSSYFSFSPDGKYLLAVDWFDAEVTIWDSATGEKVTRINRNEKRICCR